MELDDLICEIAHECGYRKLDCRTRNSYQTLKFIKLFNGVIKDLLQSSSSTIIPQHNIDDIAETRTVVIADGNIFLPSGKTPREINMCYPESVEIIKEWFGDHQT